MYGRSEDGVGGARPPAPSGGLGSALWLLSALVVVVVAAVTIAVVLHGGTGSPQAGGSTTPTTGAPSTGAPSTGTPSTGTPETDAAPTTGAPTTDVLPSNALSATCDASVPPNLVAVAVLTELSSVTGGRPTADEQSLFADCVGAQARAGIARYYGLSFGVDYSGDLTGGHDQGPSARYTVGVDGGSNTFALTLTKQQDGHYEVTALGYA